MGPAAMGQLSIEPGRFGSKHPEPNLQIHALLSFLLDLLACACTHVGRYQSPVLGERILHDIMTCVIQATMGMGLIVKVVVAALLAVAGPSHGFATPLRHVVLPGSRCHANDPPSPLSSPFIVTSAVDTSTTALRMASDDEGGGIATKLALVGVLVVFLITSILPFLGEMQADTGPANLSGAVATRDAPDSAYKNYESSFDRLSRAKIQEKLSRVPAFYLVDKVTGRMAPEIYASYEDAVDASKAGAGSTVKATTLNQVMYPLVLKRGRMMMPPPPLEIAKAEEALRGEDGAPLADGVNYKLIPSTQAKNQLPNLISSWLPTTYPFSSPIVLPLPDLAVLKSRSFSKRRTRFPRISDCSSKVGVSSQPSPRSAQLLYLMSSTVWRKVRGLA